LTKHLRGQFKWDGDDESHYGRALHANRIDAPQKNSAKNGHQYLVTDE